MFSNLNLNFILTFNVQTSNVKKESERKLWGHRIETDAVFTKIEMINKWNVNFLQDTTRSWKQNMEIF